jgi:cell division protease FtsH
MYGLNDKIGNISFYDSSGQSEYSFQKPYSEKTAQTIDEEVRKMIDGAYERTKDLLKANKEKLTKLAEQLLDKEVIFKEDVEKIFGVRPYKAREPIVEQEKRESKLKKKEEEKDKENSDPKTKPQNKENDSNAESLELIS